MAPACPRLPGPMSTKPIKKILTGRLLPLLRAEEYDAALRVYCLTIYGEVYCGLAGKGRYDASVGQSCQDSKGIAKER
jgi:hypothetical protein